MDSKAFLLSIMRSGSECLNCENLELFLPYIKRHKLQPYLQKILGENKIQQLEDQIQTINERYNLSISFLEELQHNISSPIVVIKGFSNYKITNGRILLRASSDLDILADNPILLRELLLSQGFNEIKTETGHELSELQKDDITVDLHKFVPIVSYPEGINNISRDNNITTVDGIIYSGEITYNDIVNNSIELFENVLVPNIHMSLIISCAAIFRDFITRIDQIPHFKLVDLLEIYLLTQESKFNKTILLELIERYNAYHCVEFVNCLLQEIYQVKILDGPPQMRWFPQLLFWNFNIWFVSRNLCDTVFDTSYENVLRTLGAKPINIKNHFKYDSFKNPNLVPNVLIFNRNNILMPIIFDLIWKEDLQIRLQVTNSEGINANDIINFNFGITNITIFGSLKRQQNYGYHHKYGNITYDKEKKTVIADLLIPGYEINDYLLQENMLGLNLFIEKHEPENEMNCILPIIIFRNA